MPDNQFIFSSSWLPRLRFELQTLAGYTVSISTQLSLLITILSNKDSFVENGIDVKYS